MFYIMKRFLPFLLDIDNIMVYKHFVGAALDRGVEVKRICHVNSVNIQPPFSNQSRFSKRKDILMEHLLCLLRTQKFFSSLGPLISD